MWILFCPFGEEDGEANDGEKAGLMTMKRSREGEGRGGEEERWRIEEKEEERLKEGTWKKLREKVEEKEKKNSILRLELE